MTVKLFWPSVIFISFPTERAKIAYIISCLSGRAQAWAKVEWNRKSLVCNPLSLFTKTLTQIFQKLSPGREAARSLITLLQGKRRVTDYAIEFWTLAAESGWTQPVLFDAFLNVLNDHMVSLDLSFELDALIALVSKIDKRQFERERVKECSNGSPSFSPSNCVSSVPGYHLSPLPLSKSLHTAPMKIGRTRLSPKECQRRMDEDRCIYCAHIGHFLANCQNSSDTCVRSEIPILPTSCLLGVVTWVIENRMKEANQRVTVQMGSLLTICWFLQSCALKCFTGLIHPLSPLTQKSEGPYFW